jgi:hypothetical protein
MSVLFERMDVFVQSQVTDCMRTSGWPWFVNEPSMVSMEEVAGGKFEGAGYTDMALFSLRMEAGEVAPPARPSDARKAKMDAAELKAFTDALTSCRQNGQLKLAPVREALTSAQSSQPPPVADDPDSEETKQWSSCMRKKGWKFSTTDDAFDSVRKKVEDAGRNVELLSTTVKRYEIEVIEAHRECYGKVKAQVERKYSSEFRDQLSKMKEHETEALEAMTLLDGGPPPQGGS